jgi:thioredoxin reductase (NADPH)
MKKQSKYSEWARPRAAEVAASDSNLTFARDTVHARKPVLLAIDGGSESFREIEHELRKRYADDYRVLCLSSAKWGAEKLQELKADGAEVALVLADQWTPDMSGTEFLARARQLYPTAMRALLVERWDATVQEPIVRAMTLGHIDYYVHKPAYPGDERFHKVISEFLYEWRGDDQPGSRQLRVVGDKWSARSHELKDLLGRNGISHEFFAADSGEGRDLLASTGESEGDLPVVLLHDGRTLRNPTNTDIVDASGINRPLDGRAFDIVVIGAGPAGLAAAVYGASEGLRTLVLEGEAIGGQAGMSSHIRNYLGFARGIEGAELAREAADQARLFGATFHLMRAATALRRDGKRLVVSLSDGTEVTGRAVVVSTGASYRRLLISELEALVGAGVFYGAAVSEAQAMQGQEVFVVGGANSAGQAAIHLAEYASRVTMLVRGNSLSESMSDYLIKEIEVTDNIRVRTGVRVVGGGGRGRLEHLTIQQGSSGPRTTVPATALFVLIGADPRTNWLPDEVERDPRGYVVTGQDLLADGDPPPGWPLERCPLLMETSMPGVFAAGDVRYGSVKRVASAVGAGAITIQSIHEYLAGTAPRQDASALAASRRARGSERRHGRDATIQRLA